MSSTSSSECECDEYWPYESGYKKRSFRNAFGGNPFYPTMGHPLIYYGQVPQPVNLKQCRRERRRNSPNCFVKAFRWYTEEHVPSKNMSPAANPHDMSGFATWLDMKYDQFVKDSRVDSSLYLKVKQTSVIETGNIPKSGYCEPETKKFPVKSPWRKKRRAKSNETGDVRQRSNQSFQYILQPKDISRPASDSNRVSNATVMSECSKKTVTKSQSLSNVIKSRETVDIPPFQEGTKCKNSVCQNNTRQQQHEQKTSISDQLCSKNRIENQNFSCQYAEEKALKIDVETQYNVLESAPTHGCESELEDECECQSLETKTRTPVNRVGHENRWQNKNIANSNICVCESYDSNRKPPVRSVANQNECRSELPHKTPQSPVRAAETPPPTPKITQICMASRDPINTICQCPEEKVVKVDVQTQYEVQEANCTRTLRNTACECDLEEFMRNYPPPAQSSSKKNNMCPCGRPNKEAPKEKPTVQFLQNVAQTSNHSICFAARGKETVHEYPLFMKIVCADKLSNQNFK